MGHRRPFAAIAIVAAALLAGGCQLGTTRVDQRFYLRQANPEGDQNFFRIRIHGRANLARAEFRNGWYPADAVDTAFGSISEADAARAAIVRETLRRQLDEAFVEAQRAYVAVVMSDPGSDDRELAARDRRLALALARLNQLRLGPGAELGLPPGAPRPAQLMEYNPRRGLVVDRADEKLVFILSANPDEILSRIDGAASEGETQRTLLRLFDALQQQELARLARERAAREAEATAGLGLARRDAARLASLIGAADAQLAAATTPDQAANAMRPLLAHIAATEGR